MLRSDVEGGLKPAAFVCMSMELAMGADMRVLPISQAEAEMMLARDVSRPDNFDGPPLCGKGVLLTLPLIEKLKSLGVQSVAVESHHQDCDGMGTPEQRLADLDARFSLVSGNRRMDFLKGLYFGRIRPEMSGFDGR